jgi:hypothetical protein
MTADWSHAPVGHRQDLLRKIVVEHESYVQAMDGIKRFHMPVDGGLPDFGSLGVLFGGSRAGKTFATKRYLKQHPQTVGSEGMLMPVVRVDMPAEGGPAAILGAIAAALGLLVTPRMSNQTVFAAISRAAVRAKTELMIFDEAEQFSRTDASRLLVYVRDLLRKLLDIGTFNILCVGLESTYDVLQSDPRLVGRGLLPYTRLMPYSWASRDGQIAFRLLCHGFDELLPFDERSGLEEADVAVRLHWASEGNIGRLHDLIYYGGCIALNHQAGRIGLEHLAQAYDVRRPHGDAYNPFEGDFDNVPRRTSVEPKKAKGPKFSNDIFGKSQMAVGLQANG